MKDKIVMFLPFALAAALVLVNACDSRADSLPPAPRLARQLAPEAAARAAARARHNDALKTLFREVGLPEGSDPASVAARAAALGLINSAIREGAELDGYSGITADQVAAAAADYARRHAPTLPGPGEDAPDTSFLTGLLIVGDSHAACYLPHGGPDSWIVAERLNVPWGNRHARSGSTAAQWAADHEGWLSAALSNRAPVVWISLGGNDGAAAMADGSVSLDEYLILQANLQSVIRTLARGRALVITTAYADPLQGIDPRQDAGLAALNSAVRLTTSAVCDRLGVPWRVLEEPEIIGPENFDGSGDLHPDAAGYEAMAEAIGAIIRRTTGLPDNPAEREKQ